MTVLYLCLPVLFLLLHHKKKHEKRAKKSGWKKKIVINMLRLPFTEEKTVENGL